MIATSLRVTLGCTVARIQAAELTLMSENATELELNMTECPVIRGLKPTSVAGNAAIRYAHGAWCMRQLGLSVRIVRRLVGR